MTSEFAYSIEHTIIEVDNDANWMVLESGWSPGTYDLIVYVESAEEDGMYACTATFGNESIEDAKNSDLSAINLAEPLAAGSCGSASFTFWKTVDME